MDIVSCFDSLPSGQLSVSTPVNVDNRQLSVNCPQVFKPVNADKLNCNKFSVFSSTVFTPVIADNVHSGQKSVFCPAAVYTPHGILDILGRQERPLNLAKTEAKRRHSEEEERRNCGEEDDRRKRKKLRTTFSVQQISTLERMFGHRKYINCVERRQISRWDIADNTEPFI